MAYPDVKNYSLIFFGFFPDRFRAYPTFWPEWCAIGSAAWRDFRRSGAGVGREWAAALAGKWRGFFLFFLGGSALGQSAVGQAALPPAAKNAAGRSRLA